MTGPSMKSENKAIWAFDVFEDSPAIRSNIVRVLSALASGEQLEVQSVYVLSAERLALQGTSRDEWMKKLENEMKIKLAHDLKGKGSLVPLKPAVLFQEDFSLTRSAMLIDEYALSQNAQFIISSTCARRGLNRLLLGSFTESLLAHARMPVLAFSPYSRLGSQKTKVLFPTDFSETSRQALRGTINWAMRMGAKIIIYHGIQEGFQRLLLPHVSGPRHDLQRQAYDEFLERRFKDQVKKAEEFAQAAHKRGLLDSVKVEGGVEKPDMAIVAMAEKENCNLIAMAAESSPLTVALLGSTTKRVVLRSPCPVLIFHRQREDATVTRSRFTTAAPAPQGVSRL